MTLTIPSLDDSLIIQGDALAELKKMDSGIVQTCITSPPYWGLRDYGVEGQIGLEESPEEYVSTLVEIFAEVRRVLRDDGTLWLVLGDSYAGATRSADKPPEPGHTRNDDGRVKTTARSEELRPSVIPGLKPKDLVGVPWRVAFALQADGWYLRSDIIWSKPNPMPESITDRPTKAHEYIFLLAKSQRYFYDKDAILEPLLSTAEEYLLAGESNRANHEYSSLAGSRLIGEKSFTTVPAGRNKRTVWTVATQPYPEAHFAVYPPKLIEPCVLAGSADRACEICGAPWERVVECENMDAKDTREYAKGLGNVPTARTRASGGGTGGSLKTIGFQPTCTCDNEGTGRCIVLDPFCGSGTTGLVALKHRRKFIGIELNPKYVKLTEKRLGEVQVCLF